MPEQTARCCWRHPTISCQAALPEGGCIMRYLLLFVTILLTVSITPALAQNPVQNGILVLVDGTSLVSFAPGNPEPNAIGDISDVKMPEEVESLSVNLGGYTPTVSPDGQWLVWSEYSPATLVYGRTGGETIFVPLDN